MPVRHRLTTTAGVQESGPTQEEVDTALMVEQRGHEEAVQENTWWLDVRGPGLRLPLAVCLTERLQPRCAGRWLCLGCKQRLWRRGLRWDSF